MAFPLLSTPISYAPPVALVPLGRDPTHMVCPHCNAEIDTSIREEPSLLAWISGGILALIGCVFGCCLIPCCIPSCMNVVHSCPNCKAHSRTFNSR